MPVLQLPGYLVHSVQLFVFKCFVMHTFPVGSGFGEQGRLPHACGWLWCHIFPYGCGTALLVLVLLACAVMLGLHHAPCTVAPRISRQHMPCVTKSPAEACDYDWPARVAIMAGYHHCLTGGAGRQWC